MAKENQQNADIEANLRQMAEQADSGVEEFPDPFASENEDGDLAPSDADKDKDKPEEDESKTKDDVTPKPGDGTDSGKDKPGDKEQEQQDTQYQRAKKEAERKDRSWKALEAEKEAIRKEREDIESKRKEIEEKSSKSRQPVEIKDERGYTASDYDRAAEEFRERGDADLALKATNRAKELREQSQRATAKQQQETFTAEWRKGVDDLVSARAELQDGNTELSKRVQQLLKDEPYFSHVPDGFKRAVEFAEKLTRAESVPSLEVKVAELQKEIDRLNALTATGSSGPTSKPKAKKFEDMSSDEQEASIRAMAEEADARGGLVTAT